MKNYEELETVEEYEEASISLASEITKLHSTILTKWKRSDCTKMFSVSAYAKDVEQIGAKFQSLSRLGFLFLNQGAMNYLSSVKDLLDDCVQKVDIASRSIGTWKIAA